MPIPFPFPDLPTPQEEYQHRLVQIQKQLEKQEKKGTIDIDDQKILNRMRISESSHRAFIDSLGKRCPFCER